MIKNNPVWRTLLFIFANLLAIGFSYGIHIWLKDEHPLFQILIITTLVICFFWLLSLIFKMVLFQAFEGIFVSIIVIESIKIFNLGTYFFISLILIWGIVRTLFAILTPPPYFEEPNGSKRYFFKNLFINHFIPGFITFFLVLSPLQFLESVRTEVLNLSTLFAFCMAVIGLVTWTMSQIQIFVFKRRNKEGFLTTGLWKWSRHPDIFGEVFFWFGIFLMMLSLNMNMWSLFLGPIAHFLFFNWYRIPRLEERNLERFEEYRIYQQKTNPLLVWPKPNDLK